ncbi:33_t:CDS:2, partial [Gigaspora rosea]
ARTQAAEAQESQCLQRKAATFVAIAKLKGLDEAITKARKAEA